MMVVVCLAHDLVPHIVAHGCPRILDGSVWVDVDSMVVVSHLMVVMGAWQSFQWIPKMEEVLGWKV